MATNCLTDSGIAKRRDTSTCCALSPWWVSALCVLAVCSSLCPWANPGHRSPGSGQCFSLQVPSCFAACTAQHPSASQGPCRTMSPVSTSSRRRAPSPVSSVGSSSPPRASWRGTTVLSIPRWSSPKPPRPKLCRYRLLCAAALAAVHPTFLSNPLILPKSTLWLLSPLLLPNFPFLEESRMQALQPTVL